MKWPFKLQVRFSIGYSDAIYEPAPPAQQALEMAVNVRPADTPGLQDSLERAEAYLKFLQERK